VSDIENMRFSLKKKWGVECVFKNRKMLTCAFRARAQDKDLKI